jgi:hypothetical protein
MASLWADIVNKAIQYSKPGTTETCIAELPIESWV